MRIVVSVENVFGFGGSLKNTIDPLDCSWRYALDVRLNDRFVELGRFANDAVFLNTVFENVLFQEFVSRVSSRTDTPEIQRWYCTFSVAGQIEVSWTSAMERPGANQASEVE